MKRTVHCLNRKKPSIGFWCFEDKQYSATTDQSVAVTSQFSGNEKTILFRPENNVVFRRASELAVMLAQCIPTTSNRSICILR